MRHLRIAAFVIALCGLSMGAMGRAGADVLVMIDKSSQQMSVSVDGRPRYLWEVSTGRAGYGTPSGQFQPQWMARTYFSRKYYNSPMPYSIFFYRGYAIHGTENIHRLGGPASHGCVRLHPRHAATLFALVRRHGMDDTRIIIGNSLALRRPERWGAREQDEQRLIARTTERLLLSEQIERKEALAKMERARASEALRRITARNSGAPFVPDPEALTVKIGVEWNRNPAEPENVVMERPEPASAAVPLPRRRALSGERNKPRAATPAKPAPRAERRRQEISSRSSAMLVRPAAALR